MKEYAHSALNVKALIGAFNQEKALVGAFSVITNLRMDLFQALYATHIFGDHGDLLVGDADVLGDVRQVGGEHLQAARVAQNLRVGMIFTSA